MATRYLRNIKDGTIYEWHPVLAAHPLCQEVSEQEAFPEKFAAQNDAPKTRKRRKVKQDNDDGVENLPQDIYDLVADISEHLPE